MYNFEIATGFMKKIVTFAFSGNICLATSTKLKNNSVIEHSIKNFGC